MDVHWEMQALVNEAKAFAGDLVCRRNAFGMPISPVHLVFKQG